MGETACQKGVFAGGETKRLHSLRLRLEKLHDGKDVKKKKKSSLVDDDDGEDGLNDDVPSNVCSKCRQLLPGEQPDNIVSTPLPGDSSGASMHGVVDFDGAVVHEFVLSGGERVDSIIDGMGYQSDDRRSDYGFTR